VLHSSPYLSPKQASHFVTVKLVDLQGHSPDDIKHVLLTHPFPQFKWQYLPYNPGKHELHLSPENPDLHPSIQCPLLLLQIPSLQPIEQLF
jgi:hypothetical protein